MKNHHNYFKSAVLVIFRIKINHYIVHMQIITWPIMKLLI